MDLRHRWCHHFSFDVPGLSIFGYAFRYLVVTDAVDGELAGK
jgi:hypothetical protein